MAVSNLLGFILVLLSCVCRLAASSPCQLHFSKNTQIARKNLSQVVNFLTLPARLSTRARGPGRQTNITLEGRADTVRQRSPALPLAVLTSTLTKRIWIFCCTGPNSQRLHTWVLKARTTGSIKSL